MPYLPTSQAFLEQSAQLLEAYPDTTRITTKYHFPTETPGARAKRSKSQAKKATTSSPDTQPASTQTQSAPVAALTLKTYNPTTGIVLQYQTNKIAEVSRLITSLGKLAAGADVASLGLSGAGVGGDVEMVDAPPVEENVATAPVVSGKGQGQGQQGQGGKGKKKGGKGKR
ncbi:uncharacterized protein N7496_006898 [Penicillium cataractarum]|uniref:SRP9 domain-containing protein n=1 Tax=Penicillium cataractarum TaxID=2100454 RepID=A0A9W9S2J7_9EURO|nr:uncharacterized protein N7496_006898 [Penicillium cataractarum]KAJ5370806.1 hypothetical protein N7496_006898 [Penicillium cataractarum]